MEQKSSVAFGQVVERIDLERRRRVTGRDASDVEPTDVEPTVVDTNTSVSVGATAVDFVS